MQQEAASRCPQEVSRYEQAVTIHRGTDTTEWGTEIAVSEWFHNNSATDDRGDTVDDPITIDDLDSDSDSDSENESENNPKSS